MRSTTGRLIFTLGKHPESPRPISSPASSKDSKERTQDITRASRTTSKHCVDDEAWIDEDAINDDGEEVCNCSVRYSSKQSIYKLIGFHINT